MRGIRAAKSGASEDATGKALVVVAEQQEGPRIGRIRLRRVPDGSAPSMSTAIQAAVEPGSSVRTDGWKAYRGLPGNR